MKKWKVSATIDTLNRNRMTACQAAWILFSGLCLLVTQPTEAQARIDIHAQGQLGIESGSFAGPDDDDQRFNGFSAGALARLPFSPYEFGLGLSYINWTWSTANTDQSLSQFLVSLESGFHISPFEKFTLAALIGYDFGLFGSLESESGNTTVSIDTDSFIRRTHTFRGLYQLTPKISLGADFKFMTGFTSYQFENEDIEPEFDLWGFKLIVDYRI
jgi:hypothetical protein